MDLTSRLIFFFLLIASSFFDIKTRRIPNWLILIGALPLLVRPNLFTFLTAAIALIFGLFSTRWIGSGDIKLAFLIAAYSHIFSLSQMWIYLALVSGGIFALISRQRAIAFAPFMALGVAIAYLARAQSII